MSWSKGQPLMILGVSHVDFTPEGEKKAIVFNKVQAILDDTAPRDGAGFNVTEARTDEDVSPGWYTGTVSFKTTSGGAKCTLSNLTKTGPLPEFSPPAEPVRTPNGASKPQTAAV